MSDPDSTSERLRFAAERVLNRDVMAMERDSWTRLVRSNGMPTLLTQPPQPYEGVMKDAMVVAVAASGICNPDPGMDIVRYDPDDRPHVYNVDHYRVCENLGTHPHFAAMCKRANVEPTADLVSCLSSHVFVIRNEPGDTPDHWSKELPLRIQIAKHKEDEEEVGSEE